MAHALAHYTFGLLMVLSGCAWAGQEPEHSVFAFEDRGQANYHTLDVGSPEAMDTLVFVIGGSGCSDVGTDLLPRIADAMGLHARYLALNKRHVALGARGKGSGDGCGREFNENDIPRRWLSDTRCRS